MLKIKQKLFLRKFFERIKWKIERKALENSSKIGKKIKKALKVV